MTDEIKKILSSKIDSELVNALIDTYDSVNDSYYKEDYETTLSKSGKFVENVFRVLYFEISKTKLTEIKPGQLNSIFEKLEKADSKKFSDTIRIVIPRVAMTVYTMRSKLGSEHVKPITPDFLDAKYTVASCDWIISELLRSYHVRDSDTIRKIIQNIKSKKLPKLDSFEAQLARKIDDLPVSDLILIVMRTKESLTKKEIIAILKKIGRDISGWINGGNFSRDLLRKGLLEDTTPSKSKDHIFSLTIKGMIKAEQLIEQIKT